MVHNRHRRAARHGRQVSQQLRLASARRSYGRAIQRVERIDAVRRRLHGDLVIHPVHRIQPLVRRNLAAGTQRYQQAVGHVALRQAGFRCLAAIHLQTNLGVIHFLVNVHVHRARHQLHFVLDFLGQRVVRLGVSPHHLNVDGARQSEIQDLIGDVGGLEERREVGKIRFDRIANLALVFLRGAVLLLIQRNQYLAVARAQRGAVAERQIDPAVGDPDVIQYVVQLVGRHDPANGFFHFGERQLGLLDARALRRAHVHAQLAGVYIGKEIFPHHSHQA